jgi:hypothetical protein
MLYSIRTLAPAWSTTTSYKMKLHFLSRTKHQKTSLDDCPKVLGGRIEGSNTIFFIPRQSVPKGGFVTYGRFVVDIHHNKTETHRVRLAVGGNLIQYTGDV